MAFVNLQRWLSVNPEESERLGRQAVSATGFNAEAAGQDAFRAGLSGGQYADQPVSRADMMQSTGGLATLSGGRGALDGALAGASRAVGDYRQQTSNLSEMLRGNFQRGAERREAGMYGDRFAKQRADRDEQVRREQEGLAADQSRMAEDFRRRDEERKRRLREVQQQTDYATQGY